MSKKNSFEVIVGTIILGIAVYFLFFLISYDSKPDGSFIILGEFTNVSGINIGSDVKLAGIKIGEVQNLMIHPVTYNAQMEIVLFEKSIYEKIPYDSALEVTTDGFFGSKYVTLNLGMEEDYLQNGEEVAFTRPSVSLESIIGKFIFNDSNS